MKFSVFRRFGVAATIGAITLVSLGGLSAAYAAEGISDRVSCELYASRPTQSGTELTGTGGRHGCVNTVNWVEASLWQDNWTFDTKISETSKGPVNDVYLTVKASTKKPGKGAYVYTYILSSTGNDKSSANLQVE